MGPLSEAEIDKWTKVDTPLSSFQLTDSDKSDESEVDVTNLESPDDENDKNNPLEETFIVKRNVKKVDKVILISI